VLQVADIEMEPNPELLEARHNRLSSKRILIAQPEDPIPGDPYAALLPSDKPSGWRKLEMLHAHIRPQQGLTPTLTNRGA